MSFYIHQVYFVPFYTYVHLFHFSSGGTSKQDKSGSKRRKGKRQEIDSQKRVNIFNYYFLFRLKNYRAHQKLKKMQQIEKEEKMGLQKEAPKKLSISNEKPVFSSFVQRCSSLARKSMPMDLEQAVCTLLHIYHQFSKCPEKSFYIKKYFTKENTNSRHQ